MRHRHKQRCPQKPDTATGLCSAELHEDTTRGNGLGYFASPLRTEFVVGLYSSPVLAPISLARAAAALTPLLSVLDGTAAEAVAATACSWLETADAITPSFFPPATILLPAAGARGRASPCDELRGRFASLMNMDAIDGLSRFSAAGAAAAEPPCAAPEEEGERAPMRSLRAMLLEKSCRVSELAMFVIARRRLCAPSSAAGASQPVVAARGFRSLR